MSILFCPLHELRLYVRFFAGKTDFRFTFFPTFISQTAAMLLYKQLSLTATMLLLCICCLANEKIISTGSSAPGCSKPQAKQTIQIPVTHIKVTDSNISRGNRLNVELIHSDNKHVEVATTATAKIMYSTE